MPKFKVRVRGSISDEVEVEADDEDAAGEKALEEWRYVEYEDLFVVEAREVTG